MSIILSRIPHHEAIAIYYWSFSTAQEMRVRSYGDHPTIEEALIDAERSFEDHDDGADAPAGCERDPDATWKLARVEIRTWYQEVHPW